MSKLFPKTARTVLHSTSKTCCEVILVTALEAKRRDGANPIEDKHRSVSYLSQVRFLQFTSQGCSSKLNRGGNCTLRQESPEETGIKELQVFLTKFVHFKS